MDEKLHMNACENPEYKKKHVPAKRVGKAVKKEEVKELEVKK